MENEPLERIEAGLENHPGDLLPEYVRGEVEDPAPLEAHLRGCARCRAEVEILKALTERAATGLTAGERDRVYQAVARQRRRRFVAPGMAWMWRAAAVLVLAAGVGLWRSSRSSGPEWNPAAIVREWEGDLAEIPLNPEDVRMALGVDPAETAGDWGALDPDDPAQVPASWEEN